MKTNYNIKNFRIFESDGADVKIAPLTILTGCNSSGKSSIAKSILLLDTYMHKVKSAASSQDKVFALGDYTMDFDSYPLNLLGRFDKVVNSKSEKREIEYRFTADNGLDVILVFNSNQADILNRGYLKRITIVKGDDVVFQSEDGTCCLNVVPFLNDYLENTKNLFKSDFFEYEEYVRSHKVSYKTINWAIDNDSLFKVPLLEKIGLLNKSNFDTEVAKILSPIFEQDKGIAIIFRRLTELFKTSECETFLDFFKMRQKAWMSRFSNKSNLDFEDLPKVPQDWSDV